MAMGIFRRKTVVARILDPDRGFEPADVPVEIRWDPLTGHTSRLLVGRGLLPPATLDVRALADATRAGCPFCPESIAERTPRLDTALVPEGRLRRGEAWLFPNLFPYGRHSVVSVYSPQRHFLSLASMTSRLVADNLAVQVEFARAATRADPEVWVSVNANHMLPSGSSLFHPHLQGMADPNPTTMQKLIADVPPERVRQYVDEERRADERWLGSTGDVDWLAAFAPVGPHELQAIIWPARSPEELTDDAVEEIGSGVSTALGLYAELGFESFNLAMYGTRTGPTGPPLLLRMVVRSNLAQAGYRSDATYLERLHWESAVDVWPEELRRRAGSRFGR
jgi:UDPglucose--hexose-1-phosphate uridylyltransferase